ncbi:hypothetical protein Tco_0493469 [Tanacetum coccineum]
MYLQTSIPRDHACIFEEPIVVSLDLGFQKASLASDQSISWKIGCSLSSVGSVVFKSLLDQALKLIQNPRLVTDLHHLLKRRGNGGLLVVAPSSDSSLGFLVVALEGFEIPQLALLSLVLLNLSKIPLILSNHESIQTSHHVKIQLHLVHNSRQELVNQLIAPIKFWQSTYQVLFSMESRLSSESSLNTLSLVLYFFYF